MTKVIKFFKVVSTVSSIPAQKPISIISSPSSAFSVPTELQEVADVPFSSGSIVGNSKVCWSILKFFNIYLKWRFSKNAKKSLNLKKFGSLWCNISFALRSVCFHKPFEAIYRFFRQLFWIIFSSRDHSKAEKDVAHSQSSKESSFFAFNENK